MKTYVYALIKKENVFLILKRPADKKSYPNYWNLPGGKLEEKESEFACVKREVMEEVHMTFHPLRKILDIVDYEDGEKRVIVFLGDAKGDLQLNDEHIDFSWIKPTEINNKKTIPYIKRIFEGALKDV